VEARVDGTRSNPITVMGYPQFQWITVIVPYYFSWFPSEKYDFVSWEYSSQSMEQSMFQTTNQIYISLSFSWGMVNSETSPANKQNT